MSGYVIHLAIAEEYIRKHKNENNNYDEFIRGVIFPDGVGDKSKTHYGQSSSKVNLQSFLREHEINSSFEKGYFLHLLTDYLFYNRYIDTFSKEVYNDYDIINSHLMKKYNVTLPERVKSRVSFKEGKTKILSLEKAQKIIDDISSMDLEVVKKQIEENPEEWTRIKKLKQERDDR